MTSAYPNAAGTLGMVTTNNQVLSCAHVLAMDSNANTVKIGTSVWQPGGLDSRGQPNPIGTLSKSTPIVFGGTGTNYADAATASLSVNGKQGQVLNTANNGFVSVSGTYTGTLSGASVSKSGRTSDVTTNQVLSPSATVVVYYTATKYAVFFDQILIQQPFLQSGDSGSVVYVNGQFVGLGFAASNTVAVACKAQHIESGLGITV